MERGVERIGEREENGGQRADDGQHKQKGHPLSAPTEKALRDDKIVKRVFLSLAKQLQVLWYYGTPPKTNSTQREEVLQALQRRTPCSVLLYSRGQPFDSRL